MGRKPATSFYYYRTSLRHSTHLTLILLTCRIWWAPNSASKWQVEFNSPFKRLNPVFTINALVAVPCMKEAKWIIVTLFLTGVYLTRFILGYTVYFDCIPMTYALGQSIYRQAVSWLTRLVGGLEPRRPMFDLSPAHWEFLKDKVPLEQVLFRAVGIPMSVIPLFIHTCLLA